MTPSPLTPNAQAFVRDTLQAAQQVSLYEAVVKDPAITEFLKLLSVLENGASDLESARHRFLTRVARSVSEYGYVDSLGEATLAWESLLIDRVLFDDNPFTVLAEQLGKDLPAGMLSLAAHDLRCLQQLYRAVEKLRPYVDPDSLLGSLLPLRDTGALADPVASAREQLAREMAASEDWGALAGTLAMGLHELGAGAFGRHIAFRWDIASHGDKLVPILRPDLIPLDQLFDYHAERGAVTHNTERFMRRLPAQNVLLYGDRGTGKSATVKAMLHRYAAHGLRMVEVPRGALADLPRVIETVRGRGVRVIVFIDDLSFEEGDIAYKELKAILEGTLEGKPENVLVYATSNRRHLIQEHFSDRKMPRESEVNPQDTLQEKLSLADRFGLTVIFPSPDQDRYLTIVEGLATSRELPIAKDELCRRALQWVVWHNGRSARTAKQFIDQLAGELQEVPTQPGRISVTHD